MKRMYSVEELVKFERAIEEQYLDDVDAFMESFEKEAKALWAENNLDCMMVFEEGELEDEEYGLASSEEAPEVFRMVYMSCRCDSVAMMIAK